MARTGAHAAPPPTRIWFWITLTALLVAAFAWRCRAAPFLRHGEGWFLEDNDTVRRLERLDAIAASATYPPHELADGFPHGSVHHWTRPMDVVYGLLAPGAGALVPGAAPLEAGAMVAGPLLAVLAGLVLALGAWRLFGPRAALLVAALHTFAWSVLNVSWFGNGDHQTLQQALLAGTYVACALGTATARPRRAAAWLAAAGGLLALAVWTSAEIQLFAWIVWLAVAVAAPPRALLAFAAGQLGVLVLGHVVEHPHALATYAWDRVSWFQVHQAAVLVAFAAARWRLRVLPAAAAAIAAGVIPFAVPALRDAFLAEIANAREVARWVRADVAEFRSPFRDQFGEWTLGAAIERFHFALFVLPFALWGTWRNAELPAPLRRLLVTVAGGAFVLAADEVKLGHLFALAFPFVLCAGVAPLLARWGWPVRWRVVLGAVVAAAVWWQSAPVSRLTMPKALERKATLEIAAFLRAERERRGDFGLLAPWSLGAHFMRYGDAAVVASGYHRNLAGIHDAYRIYAATPEDDESARALLRQRQVRYVLLWFDRNWMATAPTVLGTPAALMNPPAAPSQRVTAAGMRTLYARLRYGPGVPWLREVRAAAEEIHMGRGPERYWRLFEVVP